MEEDLVVAEDKIQELRNKYLGKDLADMLTSPTPEKFIASRSARGGSTVSYVAGHHFIVVRLASFL